MSALALTVMTAGATPAQACRQPRTALILSGGGARGLAHIGVLYALDSLGIRPDLIVGTSMGAVIGALYASGDDAARIDRVMRTLPLARLFRAFAPTATPDMEYLPPLLVWQQGRRGFFLESATVPDAEINALLSSELLRGNLLARGDFDSLPIPFRAVATNLTSREPVVLARGDLARDVRASIAIPLLLAPQPLDGRLLGDGGLSANIPVAQARALGAERVIISDATTGIADTTELDAPLALARQLVNFLFIQPDVPLEPGDVRIRPELDGMRDLDFRPGAMRRAIDAGRRAADSLLHAAACPAPPVAAPPLPAYIASFTADSARSMDAAFLRAALGLAGRDTLDVADLQRRMRRLGDADWYRAVWLTPQPVPSGASDSVSFALHVQEPPRRSAALGLAYDRDLGGETWLGVTDRHLWGTGIGASIVGRIGSVRQELDVDLRGSQLFTRSLMHPVVRLTLAKEDVRRFDESGNQLSSAVSRTAAAFAGVEREWPGRWIASLGAEGLAWRDSTRAHGRAAGGALRVVRVGTSGSRLASAVLQWNSVYRRAALQIALHQRIGKLRIVPRAIAGWGDHLPVVDAFPLGGDDGFPGLRLDERRGDREMYGGVDLSYPTIGPVMALVELAGGSSVVGGAVVPSSGWLGGARGGLGIDTPVGPIRAEYGYNTLHRGAVFVRVGSWF